ncbi:MAG: VOC family protein [Acidobacteria bacterium]|nr:VOC family protein [Acidobacteriota bacterium]
MAEVSSHAPGSFCWPELATSNQEAAKKFYAGIFGWEAHDQPIPGGTYTIMWLAGRDVGACYTLGPHEQGIPPHWNSYVAVVSADETAKKAADLGGTVLAQPFDVFESGRMAILRDPTGAVFCVWQAKKHAGITRIDEPGALCWTELATTDTKKAGTFYEQLFGWRLKVGDASPMQYTEFINRGKPIAGMMQIQPEWGPAPPNWMPYFAVADCDATAKRATDLGGSLRVPPSDIPNVGRFSVIRDPQGAVFAIVKLTAV